MALQLVADNPGYDYLPQLDLGTPITNDNVDQMTQPTVTPSSAGSDGNFFDSFTKGVLSLFDTGAQVYQKVNQLTGNSSDQVSAQNQAQKKVAVAPQTPVLFGLNQTQLLWIAGGLLGVILISRLGRR